MTGNLRDRIAAALWKFAQPDDRFPDPPEVFFGMADAVIAELDMAREGPNQAWMAKLKPAFRKGGKMPGCRSATAGLPNGRPMSMSENLWRIIGRTTPYGVHESVNGKDCYVFKRKGGTYPTDIWSVAYQPVKTFWCADA